MDSCLRESSWLVAAVVSAATLHGAHGADGMPSSIHPSPDAVEYTAVQIQPRVRAALATGGSC